MRSGSRIVLAMLVGFIGILVLPPRADAACHSFTVSASSPVTEGDPVKVTVRRDNNLDESSVNVQTVNGTAVAPADYTSTIERVEFTNETVRVIEIPTTEDKVGEPTETFKIKLTNGRGCRPNTDYQYGPPVSVTIKDDDAVVPTAVPTPKPTARATAKPTASPSASPSPSESPTASPTESPEESAIPLPTPEPDDDGLSPWLVAAAVGALVLAAGGALIATRVRRGGREI